MKANTLLENFEILAEAPGGIDRLREVILGLAVNGRLFSDTDLTKWQTDVTLKDFGGMIRGITYAKAESSKEPTPNFVPLLGAANIQRSINYEGLTFVASSLIKPSQYLKDGDILICMSSGSKHLVGKTGFVRNPPASSFGAFCGVFRISHENNRDYLAMFFKSPIYRTAISVASRGIGINNLRVGDIESIEVSLPPLAEQKRIVAKVDELMALCDKLEQQQKLRDNLRTATRKSAIEAISTATTPEELEAAWKRINSIWAVIADTPESVSSLRSLILDLAVRGKLVSQNMTAGRPLFNEVPGVHQIPKNWVWTRLDEIAEYGGVGNVSPNEIDATSWVLDLEDIEKGSSRLISKVRSSDRKTTSNKASFKAGDVLYGKLRPYLDKVLVADEEGFCTTEIVPIRPKAGIDCNWLRLSLKSPRFLSYVSEKSYGMKMPRLGTKDARESLHAVPPLEEQKSIVNKVNELMTLCDQLEFELVRQRALEESIARSLTGSLLNDE